MKVAFAATLLSQLMVTVTIAEKITAECQLKNGNTEKGKISVSQEEADADLKFKLELKEDLTDLTDVLGIFDKSTCGADNLKKANRKQEKALTSNEKTQDVTVTYDTTNKVGLGFDGQTTKMIGNAVAIHKKDTESGEVGDLVGCCVLGKSGSPKVLAGGLAQMLALATLVRMAALQIMS